MKNLLRTRIAGVLFLAALTSTVLPVVLATPPGGGGAVPPGKIYFSWMSEFGSGGSPPYPEDRGDWSMNADGKGKQQVFRPAHTVDLSHAVHAGQRWYLATDTEAGHPQRGSLYAVGGDGNTVLLLDGADLPGTRYLHKSARWGKDDSFVSFVAFDTVNEVAELWAAEISFDGVTGQPALTSLPVVVLDELQAEIASHDWSPAGDEVVYTLAIDQGDNVTTTLLIFDLVTGATRLLVDDAMDPLWSPDGARIAFQGAGTELINADGTGRKFLADGYLGSWSPDAKYIVYSRAMLKGGKYTADVLRIPAAGGTSVNLTKDIDGFAWAEFWR